jgi:alkylation response protein AidB-like acyl-CoA dehydrogenase
MDISLNEDQQRLFETALDFARNALTAEQIRKLEDTESGFAPAVWRSMAGMGWTGAPFPEQYGGSEAGFTELGLIVEALGQAAIPSPFFSTVIEAGMLLLDAGSAAQKQEWLPKIAAGDAILTTAIVEKGGSLEPEGVHTTISKSGKSLIVNGTKMFVRDAGATDAIICLGRSGSAATDVTLVMIPRQTAGVSLRRLVAAGGEALWKVTFDNVKLEDTNVVGAFNAAWPHVAKLLQRGAAFKSAELAGIGQAALDLTLSYARTRIQFDKPIGSFQAVQHHCANMYRDVEVCRLLARQAVATAKDSNAIRETSMAKAKCSVAIPAVTRTAHQVHGAIAFYRNYPLELYYNRAVAAKATYGDALYHRRVLSRMLRDNLDQFRREERHALPVYNL